MYSPRNSYGSPPPELSNNPFIDHPANALTRYPDIAGTDDPVGPSGEYTSWLQPSGSSLSTNPTGYPGQGYSGGYQQPQQTGWNAGYPQQPQQGYVPPMQSLQTSGQPFQPSSSFGQQLSAHVNGTGAYGGLPQPPQQYSGYQAAPYGGGGYQQPSYASPQNTQYLAEFDPYAQQAQAPTPAGYGAQYAGSRQHPREYVQQHKAELESWDPYTWKQAQNSFDVLKEAWGARKREIEARARAMGGTAQELARLESLAKQAELNHDSVAASSFQMQEVFTGYRQSGDLASKRRVRESINAALTSLPDWPAQQF
ncbi:hypothetical protein B0H21DRAFT_725198 [Amylocystis lapponica]|nr:hypothetical protein B0H21DRAFT_725198 [Amylocystis lapponica]